MYRLWSPTQLLRKAGKQGLIAIQKQVTKKGKTFTQTFYVKPESIPMDLGKPKVIETPEREVMHITSTSGDYEFESNRPEGGFYKQVPNKEPVKVPTRLIEKVIRLRGHTFILHRALKHNTEDTDFWNWTSEFRVSELSTGLSIGMSFEDMKDTETDFRRVIEGVSKDNLDSTIGSATKIKDAESVITDTDAWTVEAVKHKFTDEEMMDAVRNIWMNNFQGTDPMDIESWIEGVIDWMKDNGIIHNNEIQELMDRMDEISNSAVVLSHAINRNLTFQDAIVSIDAIDAVLAEILQADMDTDINYLDVSEWAHEYEDDLIMGYSAYIYGVSDNHGDEKWSPAEVARYAIEDNMSLQEAQSEAQQEVDESLDNEPDFEEIDITTVYGKSWNYYEIKAINEWVSGSVSITRETMKRLDGRRRENIGLSDLYKEIAGSTSFDIISALEAKMSLYKGQEKLYRGTKNPSWLEAEVGEVVQMGMASFSKNEVKAFSMSNTNSVVLVVDTGDMANPVIGVDIDNLLSTIKDAGYSKTVGKHTSFENYETEKEVLVRSPSVTITKIEDDVEIMEGPVGYQVKRILHIQPTEMSMVQFMKALFEDVTLEMERTFDFSLHREPEDAWN